MSEQVKSTEEAKARYAEFQREKDECDTNEQRGRYLTEYAYEFGGEMIELAEALSAERAAREAAEQHIRSCPACEKLSAAKQAESIATAAWHDAAQRVERLRETIRLIVNPATPFRVVREAVQAALTESEAKDES